MALLPTNQRDQLMLVVCIVSLGLAGGYYMYPWTKKNAASLTRDAGSGHSGGYYLTLTPKAGKTGSARNQRPINGTANTTYQTSVALLCPASNPSMFRAA